MRSHRTSVLVVHMGTSAGSSRVTASNTLQIDGTIEGCHPSDWYCEVCTADHPMDTVWISTLYSCRVLESRVGTTEYYGQTLR